MIISYKSMLVRHSMHGTIIRTFYSTLVILPHTYNSHIPGIHSLHPQLFSQAPLQSGSHSAKTYICGLIEQIKHAST